MNRSHSIQKNDYFFIIVMVLVLGLFFPHPVTILGIGFFAWFFMFFFREINNRLPVDMVIVLIATLQWVVAPAMSYRLGIDHYKYHMYIPETEYMSLAVPAVFLFYLGIRLFQNKEREYAIVEEAFRKLPAHIAANPGFPMALIVAGLFFTWFGRMLSGSLQFVGYLLSGLKYIGLIYFIFLRWKNGVWLGLFILALTIYTSLRAGMFHEFLLWLIFVSLYIANILKPNVLMKWAFTGGMLLLVLVIQLVKEEYRELLWAGQVQSGYVSTYTDLVMENLENQELAGSSNIESTVIRLNQGWIISRILSRVPDIEPFAEGETVREALKASVAPRIVNPEKKGAGGKENYERFTGYKLHRTSMGISLLGEGYANYGKGGALVFIFLMGAFYSLMLRIVYSLARSYPSLILWVPLLFLHTIKAETELIVVLNYMAKSFVLVLLMLWGLNKVFNIRI